MKKDSITRRKFLKKTSVGATGAALSVGGATSVYANIVKQADRPAILGGKPVRTEPLSKPWPMYDDTDVKLYLDAYHAKKWCRLGGTRVTEFEEKWAELMGVPYCLAVINGTAALTTSLFSLGVGAGDEVIVSTYTFVASASVIPTLFALPIFVDTDPETLKIDADKIEERITENTKAIIPVHIGGGAADMDKIMAISRKHNIPVVEDACQAWLGEWRNKKLGSLGNTGCFSFQVSKNIPCGEGGAIISSDQKLMDLCNALSNSGRPPRRKGETLSGYPYPGSNYRMTEFQGAVLLGQIRRLVDQQNLRTQNADYLASLLDEIPGISQIKKYPGETRNGYHLFMMTYDKKYFNGLSKQKFTQATRAEGIPISTGYTPLNKEKFIEYHLNSRVFKSIYSKQRLDKYRRDNRCPVNDVICEDIGLWLGQRVLLGGRKDMEDIAEAIAKVQKNSSKLL